MEKLSSQTSSTISGSRVEPLHQPAFKYKLPPQAVVPTAETLKFQCKYYAHEINLSDKFDDAIWENAQEVCFNLRANDGTPEGPTTFVRFLWTKNHLNFYVEIEQSHPSYVLNNDKVWLGDNIEFLLAPRWFTVPFYDEYEFLFNSMGSYADLHWIEARTANDVTAWNAEGIELKFFKEVALHKNLTGWAVQGKIPFSSLDMKTPKPNDYWGLGLFRKHYVNDSTELLLAWSPPQTNPPKFHTPSRFGMLLFVRN